MLSLKAPGEKSVSFFSNIYSYFPWLMLFPPSSKSAAVISLWLCFPLFPLHSPLLFCVQSNFSLSPKNGTLWDPGIKHRGPRSLQTAEQVWASMVVSPMLGSSERFLLSAGFWAATCRKPWQPQKTLEQVWMRGVGISLNGSVQNS